MNEATSSAPVDVPQIAPLASFSLDYLFIGYGRFLSAGYIMPNFLFVMNRIVTSDFAVAPCCIQPPSGNHTQLPGPNLKRDAKDSLDFACARARGFPGLIKAISLWQSQWGGRGRSDKSSNAMRMMNPQNAGLCYPSHPTQKA
jgi:hypothetical protein